MLLDHCLDTYFLRSKRVVMFFDTSRFASCMRVSESKATCQWTWHEEKEIQDSKPTYSDSLEARMKGRVALRQSYLLNPG
jgi:hypothetical protein